MTTYAFEKVVCPKCGKGYAVPKGATATFKCPNKKCGEAVQAKHPAAKENDNTKQT